MTDQDCRPTPFADQLLRHAMRDRARREAGSPASRTLPMFGDWREGIHEWVRERTAGLVEECRIRWRELCGIPPFLAVRAPLPCQFLPLSMHRLFE